MRDIGIRLVVDDTQKAKFGAISAAATAANRALQDVQARYSNPLAQYDYALNRLGASAASLGRTMFASVTAGAAGLTAALGGLGKSLIEVNERFTNLQISMGSALRSMQSAKMIVGEVMKYTARSSLPYEAIANAANVMAASPQMSGLLQKQINTGQIGNQQGTMQRYLDLINAMQVYRPDRTPDQAIFAVRSFMGGNTRSMNRVYNMSPDTISQISGESRTQMDQDFGVRLGALAKVFGNIISREALVAIARQPKSLRQNYVEQGLDIPMKMLGEGAEGSSKQPYNKITIRFQKIFDSLTEFVSTTFEEKFAPRLRDAITTTFDKLFTSGGSIATKALDALGVAGSGLSFERLYEAVTMIVEKTTNFITEMIALIDKHDLVNVVGKFISTISKTVGALVKFFVVDLEEKLSKFTFSGIGIASLAAFPAVLANIGTIVRVISNMPKGAANMFMMASGGMPAKIDANTFLGSEMMRGSSRGSNPYDIPVWAQNPKSRLSGDDYKAYSVAFRNNPVLMGRATEELTGVTDPNTRRLMLYNMMQRSYRQDTAYMTDPANAKILRQLRESGNGGNSLSGIGEAAAEERRRMPPPISTGQRMLNFGKTTGLAALGMAGGMAVSAGVTAAIIGLITVAGNVYTALTENSVAIRENSARLLEEKNNFINKVITDPDVKLTSRVLGKDAMGFLDPKMAERSAVISNLLKNVLPRSAEMKDKEEVKVNWLNRFIANAGEIGAMGVDVPGATTRNSMQTQEMMAAMVAETLDKAGLKDLPSALREISKTDTGKGRFNSEEILRKWNSGDQLGAANQFLATLRSIPGGLGVMAEELATVRREVEQLPANVARMALESRVGKNASQLMSLAANDALDAANPDEVMGKLLGLKGSRTGNSIEGLLSLSAQSRQLNTHPLAADMIASLDTEIEKNFPGDDMGSQLTSLYETQQTMYKSLSRTLEDFDANREEVMKTIDTIMKSDPEGPLTATLAKIKADPSTFNTMRRELENAIEHASNNGQVLVTAAMTVYTAIGDMMKQGAKITDESVADYSKNLSPALAKLGINFDFNTSGISAAGGTAANNSRKLSMEEQFLEKLESVKTRLGSPTEGTDLSRVLKLIELQMSQVKDRQTESLRLFGNSSMVDAIKKISGSSSQNMTALKQETNQIDANVKFLSSITDARVLSKSRFAASNSATSASTGGKLDAASDPALRDFLLSLGYKEGGTREAAIAGLMSDTRGFSKEQSLRNAIAIGQKTIDIATLSPAQQLANEKDKLSNQSIFDSKNASETERAQALSRINSIIAEENDLMTIRIQKQAEVNALTEQMYQLEFSQSKEGFFAGMESGLHTATEQIKDFMAAGRQAGATIKESFTDAFTSLVQGTQTGKEAFRSFVGSVTDMLVKMMMQKAVQMLFNFFLSAFAPAPVADSTGGYGALDVRAGATGGRVGMDRIGANAILHMARGGAITRGSGVRDDVPAMLMQGEYVIKKATAERIGYHNLDAINNDRLPHYAGGGMVGGSSVGGGHYGPSQRVVNITINVTNEGGQPKSRMDTDAQTEQMRTIADSIDALVEEKLLEHSRSRGFFKTV